MPWGGTPHLITQGSYQTEWDHHCFHLDLKMCSSKYCLQHHSLHDAPDVNLETGCCLPSDIQSEESRWAGIQCWALPWPVRVGFTACLWQHRGPRPAKSGGLRPSEDLSPSHRGWVSFRRVQVVSGHLQRVRRFHGAPRALPPRPLDNLASEVQTGVSRLMLDAEAIPGPARRRSLQSAERPPEFSQARGLPPNSVVFQVSLCTFRHRLLLPASQPASQPTIHPPARPPARLPTCLPSCLPAFLLSAFLLACQPEARRRSLCLGEGLILDYSNPHKGCW